MPLIRKIEEDSEIELSIWENIEEDEYYLQKIDMYDEESKIIEDLKSRKRGEWLSSRYLLHLMSGRSTRGHFTKDIHGKPHLKDSEYHVSISHTKRFVSVIASKKIVGIDIQTYVQKITRIQDKFVSTEEAKMLAGSNLVIGLHIIWGAKESLYKAYGLRGLDFKKHIFIQDLDVGGNKGHFKGRIVKGNYSRDFDLVYHSFQDYILVYAKETH